MALDSNYESLTQAVRWVKAFWRVTLAVFFGWFFFEKKRIFDPKNIFGKT